MNKTFAYASPEVEPGFGVPPANDTQMLVLAYTDKKRIVRVRLPMRQVAARGINPWELDLFDRDPLRLPVGRGGRALNFCRLQNVSFAYRREVKQSFAHRHSDNVFVGSHSGSAAVCFSGEVDIEQLRTGSGEHLTLRNLESSQQPFSAHYLEYLQKWKRNPASAYSKRWFLKTKNAFSLDLQSPSLISLQGDTLYLPVASTLQPLSYTGEMFDDVQAAVPLPESINWVFREFADCEPVVFGDAVTMALLGRSCNRVRVILKAGAFRQRFPGARNRTAQLVNDGCHYEVSEGPWAMPISEFVYRSAPVSVSCLYCAKPNTVIGARVAWFDLAERRLRPLKVDLELEKKHAMAFKILANPLGGYLWELCQRLAPLLARLTKNGKMAEYHFALVPAIGSQRR